MLRVTHLISGDLWAGAESATYHLVAGLAEQPGLRVSALLLNEGELASRLREAGLPVHVEPEAGRGFRGLLRALRPRLRDSDLVHAHRYKEDLLAAASGRPWVATQHGRPEPFAGAAARRMRAYLALDLLAKRLSARRVIAVSAEVEAWLAPRIGARRVIRIGNGIADPEEAPAPFGARPLRVGVLARLAPVKGIELAIDAVAGCPDLELEIVGEGPLRGALERRAAASAAASRIHFTGFDPRPLGRVAAWRALLVTSHHEGNPISVLEALALGTPVLSGPLPGVADALAGRGGQVLPDREPATWAAALEALRDPAGPGAAASLAGRARFLEAWSAERCAGAVAALYRAVARGPGSRRSRSQTPERQAETGPARAHPATPTDR